MSEQQNAAFEAAYKVAYEAALEAAQNASSGGYSDTPVTGEEDTVELSFRKLTNALRNHWIIITAITLLFAVIGFVYVYAYVTPMYQSSVNLIVQTNSTQTVSETVSNEYVNSAKNLAKTYAEILNNSRIQNDVIDDLGLDMTAKELGKVAVAEALTDSQIVKVTVTTEDKQLSAQIADAYMRIGPEDLNEVVEAGKCSAVSGVENKTDPIKPGMKRTIALMTILGFALGYGISLIKELRNHMVVSADDVKEMLGLPVLGVIPDTLIEESR